MRSNVKLVEVGRDFDIVMNTYSKDPKYKRKKQLTIKAKNIRIPLKRLYETIKKLQDRYPKKNYYLGRVKVLFRGQWRIFWIIGRQEEKLGGIPIYYSTTLKRLYVPSTFVKRKYKLVCSVLRIRLGDLGVKFRLRYIK